MTHEAGPVTLWLLFAWSFAAATILPLSSEVALGLAVRDGHDWRVAVVFATLGNVLGACTTYGLARLAITAAPAPGPRVQRASRWLARFGAPTLLLSWVPLVGDLLVALAGATRVPLVPAIAWMTIGKAARYVVVAIALRPV
jgi:membrane protein YqaA with SNARE-associated domain